MKKLVFLLFISMLCQVLYSQDGVLDTSFGNEGIFTYRYDEFNAKINNIIELSDNSLIFAGNSTTVNDQFKGFYIGKLTPNGELDHGFGDEGIIFYPSGDNETKFKMMVRQNDNKILLSVFMNGISALLRMDENGVPDDSFGNDGFVYLEGGWPRIALQNDKIILESYKQIPIYGFVYSFSRRNPDGSLDYSFGDNGYALINPTDYSTDELYDFVIQNDDKILITGQAYGGGLYSPGYSVITRLNPDGSYDNNFGNQGSVINYFSGYHASWLKEITLMDDGKIMASGEVYYSGGTGGFSGTKPLVVRYNPDGSFDNSFGDNGKVIFTETMFNANDGFKTIVIQPDSKIVLGGVTSYPAPYFKTYLYLRRLNPDGSPDMSFGENSIVIANFTSEIATVFSNTIDNLRLLANGKILIVGFKREDWGLFDVFVVRYKNDSLFEVFDNNTVPELSFYPNPVKDFLNLRNLKSGEKIEVYDFFGKKVEINIVHIDEKEAILNFSKLPKGIYILKTRSFSRKIIKN